MHEQQFTFFSTEDMNIGVMDNLIKLVQIKQWWRHDNESCAAFHYFSELRKSHCIKNLFNDVCISTLIDAAQIGVLAQLNEELFSIGLLTPFTRKSYNISLPQPNVNGARKQSMKRMVTFWP
jgi:hypothetical protein